MPTTHPIMTCETARDKASLWLKAHDSAVVADRSGQAAFTDWMKSVRLSKRERMAWGYRSVRTLGMTSVSPASVISLNWVSEISVSTVRRCL